jgi:hypothetical protein
MEISIKNADFSLAGLGNVRWVENYIINASITDATQKTALRTLFTSFVDAGFICKFKTFNVFFTAVSAKDSYNLIKPTASDPTYLTFANDLANKHTLGGYAPTTTNSFATSNVTIESATLHHMHCFVNGGTNQFKLGRHTLATSDYPNKGTSDYKVTLSAGGGGIFESCSSSSSDSVGMSGSGFVGLYSGSRNGTIVRAYLNGSIKSTSDKVSAAVIDPTIKLKLVIGSLGIISGNSWNTSENGKTLFVAYGESIWTNADELALNNMITAFKTTLGI